MTVEQLRLGMILAALCFTGCSSKEKPAPQPTPEPKPAAKKKTEPREAFGLPFPPRIQRVFRRPGVVEVDTKMTEIQAERFLRKALKGKDYEVIRTGWLTRAIPLRAMMPEVSATYPWSPRGFMRFTYRKATYTPHVVEADGTRRAKTRAEQIAERKKLNVRIRTGAPVELRTESGDLLAPGARWGKPYFPPEGSPLHHPRHRHNWGRPFGEWHPD